MWILATAILAACYHRASRADSWQNPVGLARSSNVLEVWSGMAVEPLIYELSRRGRRAVHLPAPDVPETDLPADLLRDDLDWPEVSEIDVIRHYTRVSQKNHAIDINMYPLGSCTMKYNPKINEVVARYPGFARLHPYQPESTVQGALELMFELQGMLAEISGFHSVTLQPAAGAHGELTGCLIIKAFHA